MDQPVRLVFLVQTPHGAPINDAAVIVRRANQARAAQEETLDGRYSITLLGIGDFHLQVQAGDGRAGAGLDHRILRTSLFWRAPKLGAPPTLVALSPPPGQISRIDTITPIDGGYEVRVVLDYLWFTPIGTPPRMGNTVKMLIDGEEAWGDVAAGMDAATRTIHVTTWLYQETAELRRPDPLTDPEERAPHTIHHMLSARARDGITVRLLLWDAPFIDIPKGAAEAAANPSDNFEVLQEANLAEGRLFRDDEYPVLSALLGQHPIYSFHQKTVIVDGQIGWCGGMNLKENDWDRPSHSIFDPRRAHFRRQSTFRRLIDLLHQRADHAPRHDFIARIEGPAVADLEHNFQQRWNHTREDEAKHWDKSTPVPDPVLPPPVGHQQVQVVRTMPPPYNERGILDVYLRAIGAARRLIYIEDQYFRSTAVSDAIADAVRTWPELQVIVVTLRSYADDVLQGGWCSECFQRIAARRPDFELYTLEAFDLDDDQNIQTCEVDIHAKLMLVDDIFLTVGSCNINDRGFELEGEINVAVVDPELVKATRLRLWREHLGNDPQLTGDIANDLRIWQRHAEQNRDQNMGIATVRPFRPKERTPVFDKDVF